MTAIHPLIEHLPDGFELHSGGTSHFKFEADALSEQAIVGAALWLLPTLGAFGSVEFVPSKSNLVPQWMAETFLPYVKAGAKPVLICDDVLTTGASMEEKRAQRLGVGAVIFARDPAPHWIHALMHLDPRCRGL